MTQNEKDLLLKDLCARLPYGVKAIGNYSTNCCSVVNTIESILHNNYVVIEGCNFDISNIKPYLFPLSSMTEEQKIDLIKYLDARLLFVRGEIIFSCLYANTMDRWKRVFEWCIKNHFDICGLIPMGLAIDCTNLNIY